LTTINLGKKHPIPPLYHWGHYECSFFRSQCLDLKRKIGPKISKLIETYQSQLTWIDLSECFRKNPIVINGCFKFGLKEIACRLHELGLIKSTWKQQSCVNGMSAMIMAYKAYQQSTKTGISVSQNPVMKEIMDYNKIDCVVIHEIIELLQTKKQVSNN